MIANLRVCASCEWIFKRNENTEEDGCPKCHFGHYSARYVYGNKAYGYARTQQPWLEKKMERYREGLLREIGASRCVVEGKELLKIGSGKPNKWRFLETRKRV